MVPFFSGPHGAEEERPDYWQDIPEGGDMLPGVLPETPEFPYEDGANHTAPGENAVGVGEAPEPLKETGILEELTDPAFYASESDPLGSWTGTPDPDTGELPTQDQDDM